MKIGYIRVSTEEQNEARQLEALRAAGAEKIYTDKFSGKNAERAQLQKMLLFCREGNTIVTESISRIARNVRDLLSIVAELQESGVEFVSLKESIDTSTPQGRFMLTVFGAMAELERESILQRQREGIEIAKARGVYKGRQPIKYDEAELREICASWRSGEISGVCAASRAGMSKSTFYRRVKELGL